MDARCKQLALATRALWGAGGEDRRLVYEGDQTMPLRTAVQRHFLANERGPAVHRIALFDSRGTIEYVISQMDVLRHVLSQDYEKPWVAKTLKDAGVRCDVRSPHSVPLLLARARSYSASRCIRWCRDSVIWRLCRGVLPKPTS